RVPSSQTPTGQRRQSSVSSDEVIFNSILAFNDAMRGISPGKAALSNHSFLDSPFRRSSSQKTRTSGANSSSWMASTDYSHCDSSLQDLLLPPRRRRRASRDFHSLDLRFEKTSASLL